MKTNQKGLTLIEIMIIIAILGILAAAARPIMEDKEEKSITTTGQTQTSTKNNSEKLKSINN